MFGSAAPILDMDTQSSYGDASKVSFIDLHAVYYWTVLIKEEGW